MRRAVLGGSDIRPHFTLTFNPDAALEATISALPRRRQDSGTQWSVREFGVSPLKWLADHGFEAVDSDGWEVSAVDLAPYAQPNEAGWELGLRWGCGKRRLTDLLGDPNETNPCRWNVDFQTVEGLPWVERIEPALAQVVPINGPFQYDGSVEGLKGVPLSALRTVRPFERERLELSGIVSVYDLLHRIPLRYIDLSAPHSIADAPDSSDPVAIVATAGKPTLPNAMGMVRCSFKDVNGKSLSARWFNARYMSSRITPNRSYVLHGMLERFGNRVGMSNPLIEPVDGEGASTILGVYRQSGKHQVSTWLLRRAASEAVSRLGQMLDPIQSASDAGMPARVDAYRMVHSPQVLDETRRGRDRLAYDELFRLQAVIAMQRAQGKSGVGVVSDNDDLTQAYLRSLPYTPTGAQSRAIAEIGADMAKAEPLLRLLHGEVGAGKTLVGAASLLRAVSSGHQAVLVAPTEILASQHFEGISEALTGVTLADGTPLRVEPLTGKVLGKRRKDIVAGLADGTVHIAIGTHALLSTSLAFHDLGLAIIDEQHRFGVEQRNALTGRRLDGKAIDVLQMTATPVPRTAVMVSFADLDISVLDEMPPGRLETLTKWGSAKLADTADPEAPVWRTVRRAVSEGHQAFVVTKLVSESETQMANACHETAAELAVGALWGLRIGTVTGKDKPDERHEVMSRFAAGELDVLVATTVIEVGVNVPNATVMVVLDADSFGLAQLHQLRGRVGRGRWPGRCWLVADPTTASGAARMQAMRGTTDGFKLAEIDLNLRGAGAITSTVQSGKGNLLVADLLADTDLLAKAKADAQALVEHDPKLLAHPILRYEIDGFLSDEAKAWLAVA